MKRFIFALFLAVCLPALAEDGKVIFGYKGGTNNLAAATTNQTASTVITNINNNQTLSLMCSFRTSGAATTGNLTLPIDRSIDGLIWETNYTSFVAAPDGTNTVVRGTNFFNLGNFKYFRVGQRQNSITNALTNLVLKWN